MDTTTHTHIDETYTRRRILIEGMPDKLDSHMLKVIDVASGKSIDNILSITVHMKSGDLNRAIIRYYPMDEHGHVLKSQDEEEITVEGVELRNIAAVEGQA
jgi:hypothetical protein